MIRFKWVICERCCGEGRIENSAFCNGITSSEWAQMHHEEQESYMSGQYDEPCQECKCAGKVKVVDISAMTFGEKRKYIIEQREEQDLYIIEREIDRYSAAERALGC